jgi:flagellar hook-length control protein FliK
LFGQKSNGTNIGDHMFGQLLSAQLQGSKSSSLGSSPPGSAQLSTLTSQLQTQITQMLKSGMSLEQIAQQLGGSLTSTILAQLQLQGVNVSGLRSSLTQMISQALGPPSNGPPDQTAAQMASSLVQRFTQIANALTTTVSAYATGQQHDSLGTSSDANAGGSSAPNQTAGIVQSALVALQQSAVNGSASAASAATLGSQSGGPAAPPAPWVSSSGPLGNSDTTTNGMATQTMHPQNASAAIPQNSGGPTVTANPSLTMQGTGADTVIGRILARAANVAADQANSGSNPSSSTDTPNSTATLQPQIAVSGAASGSGGAMSDSLTASLLQSLQNAINSIPQQKSDSSTTADSSAPVAGVGGAQASTLLASASFGGLSPLVSTAGNTPTTAAQSQTPAQVPVDPNAVVDQVLQGISMRTLSDGSQTLRMRLVPESLGSVTVSLQVQGSSVNATLVAQNTDVRDALLANQQMLTRSLADAGLKLAGFTVNLANQGFQQQQQAYQPRFGTTRRFVGVTTSSDDDTIASVPSYGPRSSQLAAMQWLNALA